MDEPPRVAHDLARRPTQDLAPAPLGVRRRVPLRPRGWHPYCAPNECERDADCDAGLVCKISSCDGAACVAPAGESQACNAVDFRGCTVTHPCQDALTCTVDGLCD